MGDGPEASRSRFDVLETRLRRIEKRLGEVERSLGRVTAISGEEVLDLRARIHGLDGRVAALGRKLNDRTEESSASGGDDDADR